MTSAEKYLQTEYGAKLTKDVLSIFRDADFKTISDTLKAAKYIAAKQSKLNFATAVVEIDKIGKA